jgi:hypothetical protein
LSYLWVWLRAHEEKASDEKRQNVFKVVEMRASDSLDVFVDSHCVVAADSDFNVFWV